MIKVFLFSFVLTMVASCKQARPIAEDEKAILIDSIRQTLINYYSDIRKDGLNAEFKYLDNSPDFFWVPPGYSGPISYDSVAAILKMNAPALRSIDNSFDTLHIVLLSRDIATYTGKLRSIVTDTSGHTVRVNLIETGVVIKRNDGWKLLSGQTSIADK